MAKEMSGQSLPMKVLMKLRLKCLYHPKNLSEEQEQKKNMCVRWEMLAGAASHVFWGFLVKGLFKYENGSIRPETGFSCVSEVSVSDEGAMPVNGILHS